MAQGDTGEKPGGWRRSHEPGEAATTEPAAGDAVGTHRIRCPYCSEMILAAARKCRFCGEMLDSSLPAAPLVPVVSLGESIIRRPAQRKQADPCYVGMFIGLAGAAAVIVAVFLPAWSAPRNVFSPQEESVSLWRLTGIPLVKGSERVPLVGMVFIFFALLGALGSLLPARHRWVLAVPFLGVLVTGFGVVVLIERILEQLREDRGLAGAIYGYSAEHSRMGPGIPLVFVGAVMFLVTTFYRSRR
jgi:hypothetical protein